MKKFVTLVAAAAVSAGLAFAGDAPVKPRENKDRAEFQGTMVSLGAALEALGANAQDTLYTKGALALQAPDGTLWTFVDNEKGHSVIRDATRRPLASLSRYVIGGNTICRPAVAAASSAACSSF